MLKKVITGLLVIAFTICTCASSYADSNCSIVTLDKESQELLEKVQRYVSTSNEGLTTFDVNAAALAGEDERVVEIGRKFNEFSRASHEEFNKRATLDKESQELLEKVQRYVSTSNEGLISFDVNAAALAGEDERVVEIGRKFNEFSRAMRKDPGTRDGMPIWGNWCGPGHSGPEPPTDMLDAICQMHDECYASRGYLACSCDAELRALIAIALASGKLTPEETIVALAIFGWFSASPCIP